MTRIRVAKILNAHGIKGFVKLRVFAEDIYLIEDPDVVLYRGKDSQEPIKITLKNAVKGDFLAAIDGVNDRNAAEELRHLEIFMDEGALPELEEDEFYHKDMAGLKVFDKDGNEFGKVKSIQNFGAEDLFEISPNAAKNFYLPYRDEFIINLDVDEKKLTIQDYEDYME